MPTRIDIMTETMRRLGACQRLLVSMGPDATDSAAQRKLVSSDLYSIDKTLTTLGQANLWVGRYGEGNKIRVNSYNAVSKAVLDAPETADYTLTLYGYGTTATLTPSSDATAIQTAIRNVSASLATVTVSGSDPYTITLPSASITIELTKATADATGSVTQGLASVEAIRPFSIGLPYGTEVWLFPKYPADDRDGLVGMTTLVNQALARLWFIDMLHFHSTDSESQQVSFSLADHPYLKTRRQVLRAYAPVAWKHTFAYTVPVGAHTITLEVGYASTVTTASIAGSASAATIAAALTAALSADGVNASVSVTEASTTRTVVIEDTFFADWAYTVSSGATVTTTHERTAEMRVADGFRLRYDGELLHVEWDGPWQRGYTWFLEVYRPAHTLVCPQTDYQTLGTTWTTSTVGLSNDLDQCVADLHEVASVTHYLACRQLALYGPGQESKFWRTEQQRAATIAAYVKSLDLPTNEEPGFNDDGLSASRYMQDKGFWTGGNPW